MSAILGVFGSPAPLSDEHVRDMLGRMTVRGMQHVQIWREADVVLAVGRYEWELDPAFSGDVLIAQDGDLVAAVDASIFYRRELRTTLASSDIRPRSNTAAHLILAAWRAWGRDCVQHLDGDFAFVLWDRRQRHVLCARDFVGRRPLFYAQLGSELVVASMIGGVAAHPRCPDDLNLPVIGGTLAGMHFSAGPETAISAVRVLAHAHRMCWTDGNLSAPERYWEAPVTAKPSHLPEEDAATYLRDLLATAAAERLDPGRPNTVWMSGGWDSTAVFGAAQFAHQQDPIADAILPVSISYPVGDPGREDHWIQAVADHWHVPINWIDIRHVPFFDDELGRASERHEPWAHLYERWNGALAVGSRACGARVALDGNGGDQLFQNSDVFLADLLRSGNWLTLAREWRARPRGGFRHLFATVIQPHLTPSMHTLATRVRGGRRLRHYLERPIPNWISSDFVESHKLADRDHHFLTRNIRATLAGREIDWGFSSLFGSRGVASIGTFALREGVEVRSPILDRRIIDFALSRPWWERSSGRETKILLRRSMRDLLPAEVIAPRKRRTGITGGYSHQSMVNAFPTLLTATMQRPLILEELGIVKPDALLRACGEYPRRGDSATRVGLFYTLQTELWLRARAENGTSRATSLKDVALSYA